MRFLQKLKKIKKCSKNKIFNFWEKKKKFNFLKQIILYKIKLINILKTQNKLI